MSQFHRQATTTPITSIGLAADYGADIQIEYVEVDRATLRRQNLARAGALPDAAMSKLQRRWQPTDVSEGRVVR